MQGLEVIRPNRKDGRVLRLGFGKTALPVQGDSLRQSLRQEVKTSADYGIPIDAKEAIAFAILAYESFHGRPGNVPSATGAARAVILGKDSVP